MFDTALRPETTLEGALDIEAIISRTPRGYTVKGMFCTRFAEMLGDAYQRIEPKLAAPPRDGRFVPFKDYPQGDYTRIVAAAAAKRFPELAPCEAMRRIARDDIATFSASMFGRIVFTVIGDARSSLLRVPDAYHRVAPGPTLRAEELDEHATRITFEGYCGCVEYVLGQLEGIVLSYGCTPVVTVRKWGAGTLHFDVVHDG